MHTAYHYCSPLYSKYLSCIIGCCCREYSRFHAADHLPPAGAEHADVQAAQYERQAGPDAGFTSVRDGAPCSGETAAPRVRTSGSARWC